MFESVSEREKSIILKYPILFGFPPFDESETLMGYGLGVNEVWLPTLEDLFDKLSVVVNEDILVNFRIIQVKTKFGILCIYTEGGNFETADLIHEAMLTTSKTCEICGKQNFPKSRGMTGVMVCDECFKTTKDKRNENTLH